MLAAAAAAGTGVQVGLAMVATRFVIGESDPASLGLLRYAIGFACLLPGVVLGPRVRIAWADLPGVAALGVVQFGLLIALLNYGQQYVSAGRAALLFATFPLLTMLLAAALGRERLGWAKSVGVGLSIVGVGLAVGDQAGGTGSEREWLGTLAVLASALCGAACAVLSRPFVNRYPALPLSAWAMLAAVAFLAFPAAAAGFFSPPPRFSFGGWLAVAFIGASSGAGYYLWLWALRHATPTRVTVFLGLSPITAALVGALLLGETLSPLLLLGLVCVVAGLAVAHVEPRPPRG